jgi:hypothetical protein
MSFARPKLLEQATPNKEHESTHELCIPVSKLWGYDLTTAVHSWTTGGLVVACSRNEHTQPPLSRAQMNLLRPSPKLTIGRSLGKLDIKDPQSTVELSLDLQLAKTFVTKVFIPTIYFCSLTDFTICVFVAIG